MGLVGGMFHSRYMGTSVALSSFTSWPQSLTLSFEFGRSMSSSFERAHCLYILSHSNLSEHQCSTYGGDSKTE
ncbi:hypothetical protein BD410DRAFT_519268 [Rickenella mellea]|uniref:Uncharacterized protein n=1 Tax=Rickenella mellea TaxID=50990 RepID=A0A4Y7QFF5_9AGAM|nr:hypothetical protein BD410DRAFT_519268 [Rickenella mellea]